MVNVFVNECLPTFLGKPHISPLMELILSGFWWKMTLALQTCAPEISAQMMGGQAANTREAGNFKRHKKTK